MTFYDFIEKTKQKKTPAPSMLGAWHRGGNPNKSRP